MAFDLATAKPVQGADAPPGGFDLASAKPIEKATPASAPSRGATGTWDQNASAKPRDRSADESEALSGQRMGQSPESGMDESMKKVFTGFLDKEAARPRFDPNTGQPAKASFTDALDAARLKSNFFGNLAEGFAKKGREFAPKLPEAMGGVDLDTIASRIRTGTAKPAELFTYNNMLKDLVDGYKISTQEDPKGFFETLQGTVEAGLANPTGFAGQLVAGLLQDPEMVALGGLGTGGKLAGAVKQYKRAAEAAGVGLEATAGGAAMSAAGQMAEGVDVRLQRTLAEGVQIGLPMGMIHLAKGAKAGEKPELKPATEEDFQDPKSFGDYLKAQVDEHVERAQQRIEPGPLSPVEKVATAERPFSDAAKWDTPRLERIAAAAETRIAETKTKFEEAKTTDRRRRMKSLGTEELGEHSQRMEDQLKLIKDELTARKGGGSSSTVAAVSVIGATAAALALTNSEIRDKATTGAIIAAAFFGLPEGGRAMGPLFKAAERGGRVLERLAERSPGKIEFKKAELESEMNRQDVPKAEREVLERVIAQFPGDSVRAADLVHHFQLETQNFELKSEMTPSFATYGIDGLGRLATTNKFAVSRTESSPHLPVLARTDIWKLPGSWNIPAKGHFEQNGPNQYGHTRSFIEGNVRHVVEMQSDLQQHLTPLSPEEIKANEREIQEIESGHTTLSEMHALYMDEGARPVLTRWSQIWHDLDFTPRYVISEWIKNKTPELNRLNLIKIGENGVEQSLAPDVTKAIRTAMEVKYERERFDPTLKVWEKVNSIKVAPRSVAFEATDAWSVELEVQPRSWSGEPTGPARLVVEPVNTRDVISQLVGNGWIHRDLRGMFEGVIANLEMRRGELSARMGSEPAKAELRAKLRPIGEKIWPRRLIQEELARAGREGMPVIRYATADTVAKVEHWPRRTAEWKNARKTLLAGTEEGTPDHAVLKAELEKPDNSFVSSAHESIYKRYADEIGKYLKSLGGKEVTDSFGHTWLEVPTRSGIPARQFGAAEPQHLARLAALGIGAAAGAYLSSHEHKLLGALEGALAGGILVAASGGLRQAVKDLRSPDTRIRITHIGDDREELIHRLAIDAARTQTQIETLLPNLVDREHLTEWLKGDRSKPLNQTQQRALGVVRKWFEIPELGGRTAKAAAERFSRTTEGMKDISAIVGAFGNAVARSIADTRMLDALEEAKDFTGNSLIMGVQKKGGIPDGYVHLEHPLLAGYRVHPDIVSSLRLMLDTARPAASRRVAWALLMGTKRALVTASLFHATALSFAAQAASSNPLKFVKLYAQAVSPRIFGENIFLKQLREQGHAGPMIDKAVQGGLNWSLGRETGGTEDVKGFYAGMHDIAKFAETVPAFGPVLGITTRSIIKLNQRFDGFMWDRLHAGMKLDIFAEKYQQLLENNAKALEKDPKTKPMSEREAARISAEYSNAIFGGLNWRRAAESVRSRLMRDVTSRAFSPLSRRIAQVVLFAPDWLVSTATPWFVSAFGKGTGLKGILNAQTTADLHRQYLIRSGFFYLVAGDAINHAMSGHHIWDNKNPLQIDMDPQGDRHMIFNKHFLEIPHGILDPQKQVLGKLSYPVKEALNQLFGTEYLSPRKDPRSGQITAGPAMEGGRLGHAARGLEPIAVQQGFGGGAETGAMGFFGLPVYGKTREQKVKDAAERRRKRIRQQIDQVLQK